MSGRAHGGGGGKAATDNRANQMNPNNPAYVSSRGGDSGSGSISGGGGYDKAAMDNHANQLNPNNPEFGGGRAAHK